MKNPFRFCLETFALIAPFKVRLGMLIAVLTLVSGTLLAQPAPVWIRFDNLSAGTRVDDQYAEQGVRFVNDYTAGRPFRSSPQITASASARSAPHVLVNTAFDPEVFSSANVPMVLHFAVPISGVGMQLGYVSSSGVVTGATVRLYDCQGNLRGVGSALPRSDFLTPLQVLDSSGSTRLVVIDYGSSTVPEAMDDLAFQPANGTCADTSPPVVKITSHQDQQIVANPNISLRGRVEDDSGYIALIKVNGVEVPATPHPQTNAPPAYDFERPLALQPGANSITVVAWDAAGLQGSTNFTLHYGPPATVQLAEFHLTQRGIMQTNTCDVDEPLVAGKFTIVRVRLDARTAGGTPTYVERVQMYLWRRVGMVNLLAGVVDGTTYSPFVSWFEEPSELAGVHFWVEESLVDVPGDYTMTFQPFIGTNAVGAPLLLPCANRFFTFSETKPITLLMVPVEAPLFSPDLPERNHRLVFDQLAQVARTYPVREGVSLLGSGGKTGIKVVYGAPYLLCDGINTNQFCLGTGFEWTFKDAHPNGLSRAYTAARHEPGQTNCTGSSIIGGIVISNDLLNLPRRTPFGYFTPGAPPQWRPENKFYTPPLDDNHNGQLDLSDLANAIAEFQDPVSGMWLTDLTQYTNGMTFNSYRDLDGDHCSDANEPVTAVGRRYQNMKDHVLWAPANQARNVFNQQNPSTPVDHASLWLAPDIHPWFENTGFLTLGPGQGSQPGAVTWVSPRLDANDVANCNVLPHELGHNFNLSHEVAPVPAWLAYIYYRQVNAAQAFTTMNPFILWPDRSFFRTNYYRQVFDQLKASNSPAAGNSLAEVSLEPALFLTGVIDEQDRLTQVDVSTGESLEFTASDRNSPWRLVLGGRGETRQHLFPVAYGDLHPETSVQPMGSFRVVVPLPEGTDWIEIRREESLQFYRERSEQPPMVEVMEPNGGEVFAGDEVVRVAWEAWDPDDDPLTFSVLYSPNGEEWWPVATGLTEPVYLWNAQSLPGGAEAKMRVVASDGFHQTQDDSDEVFHVEGKPPLVVLQEPRPDRRFLEGQFIPLRALALDPEGAFLQVTWFRDDQPVAQDLTSRLPPQTPGPHGLVLRVEDAQGYVVYRETGFFVVADSDRDGMSDDFERDFGLDLSWAGDARDDADGDGLTNFDEAGRELNPRERDSDGDGVPDGDEVQAGFDPRDPSSTPPCLSVPEGLVSWWAGDESPEDRTGRNPGYLEPGTTIGLGKVGAAFQLNGEGGVWVESHSSLLPEIFTVAAWIYPTSYEGNRVLEKGGHRVGGGYGFEFNPFGSLGLRFVVWNEGPQVIDSDGVIPLHTWTHVAGTFDGATMRLYVNGMEQAGTRAASMTFNDAPLTIGRAAGGYDLFFLGLIDEVQLYERPLPNHEIEAIYAVGSAGVCPGCLTGPPVLHIERSEDWLEIFWPRCPEWILEETEFLTTPFIPWQVVPPESYQVTGPWLSVSVPAPAGAKFYRLLRP